MYSNIQNIHMHALSTTHSLTESQSQAPSQLPGNIRPRCQFVATHVVAGRLTQGQNNRSHPVSCGNQHPDFKLSHLNCTPQRHFENHKSKQ